MNNTHINKNIEFKKDFLRRKINDYIHEYTLHGFDEEAKRYEALNTAIDFAESESSLKMVDHLYNIRFEIEKCINSDDFGKKYTKLNEKLYYQMEKMINKIFIIDYSDGSYRYRINMFKSDSPYYVDKQKK